MEDFTALHRSKRAPPQRLFEYFNSLGDNHKYILEQQEVVRQQYSEWLDIPADKRDELLDSAFEVPDTGEYPEERWGMHVVSTIYSFIVE